MTKYVTNFGLAAAILFTSPQAMTLKEFLGAAGRIPQSGSATNVNVSQVELALQTSFRTIRIEQKASIAAGIEPATCMPETCL